MIITRPGKISSRITLLGREESCVYLVEDNGQAMLLGGGMAHIAPDLNDQLAHFAIDERRIGRILILHAHFDHCGAVPYLKRRWPWAEVVASRRAAELLNRPEVQQGIARMNQEALERRGLGQTAAKEGYAFDGLQVDASVGEAERLRCGEVELEVIEVPGHSSCSIAVHLAVEKALFASDALGLYRDGVHQPTPNSDFDRYQQSLARMAQLHPELILMEHFGAVAGQAAAAYIPMAIAAAREMRQLIENTYRRTGDIEQCTQEVTALFLKRSPDAFLPDSIRATVAAQMVRFIAKGMG